MVSEIGKSESFKKIFSIYMNKNIVIYGTNAVAEKVIHENPEFRFVGIIDEKRKNGYFMDKKILSEREILSLDVELIIITEDIQITFLTYQTIYYLTAIYNIPIFHVTGLNLWDAFKKIDSQTSQYMFRNERELKKKIGEYDIISFDIFDTLIMRTTLFPRDVFELVRYKAESRGIYIPDFMKIRREAERRINHKIPNIYQIYDEIQRISNISDIDKEILRNLEIEIESEVIIPRHKMVEIFYYALELGKTVYLVSDMYLPKEILEPIIHRLGISGYFELLISCDYGTNKCKNMFDILRARLNGKKCLHVGDNVVADILGALSIGFDAFYIKSAYDLISASEHHELIKNSTTLNERNATGLLISNLFNSPFSLYEMRGKIRLNTRFDIGYTVFAPILIGFSQWMNEEAIALQCVKEKNDLMTVLEEIGRSNNSSITKSRLVKKADYVVWLLSYEERFRKNLSGYKIYVMQDSVDKKQIESADGDWYIDNETLRKKSGKYLNSNIKLIKKFLSARQNCIIHEQIKFGIQRYAEYYLRVLYTSSEQITSKFSAVILNQFDMEGCL